MKPLQVGLLIAAGALGGVVVMRVVQRPQAPAAVMVAARTQPAAPAAATAPAPAPAPVTPPAAEPPAPAPAEPSHPSPFVPPPEARKPIRKHAKSEALKPPAAPAPEPVQSAAAEVPPPAASPAPEPVAPAPAPQPAPPAQPEPEHVTPLPPPAPPEPRKVTLNAGTLIQVRLVDGLTTERNTPGDPFTATLDKELVADGFVIAERGARVEGRVISSDRGGRVSGVASLGVEITRIHLSDGQTIAVSSDPFVRRAEQSRGEDAAKVGAGAAIGAIIGAIAGGGKGAAIGAGAGGAAGVGTVAATRGKPVALPSETRLAFRLRTPVTVTERR